MRRVSAAAVALAVSVGGCTVGPDYQRPDAPTSASFKELSGWKPAQPQDATDKGDWWAVYHDPELDRLERMVAVSNQTVKEFEAQYRNAVALVGEARAGLFPTVGVTGGVTRSSGGGGHGSSSSSSSSLASSGFTTGSGGGTGGGSGGPTTLYSIEGDAAWDLDVWGRVRRQIESNVAGAQVSAGDLANAELSAQATLATDYFDLRSEDALEQLLRDTADAFRRALQIVTNQYHAGTAASTDMVTARAQLQGAEAQLVGVGVQRQQFEHAIAMLTGHAPADLTIAPAPLASAVPVLPPGLPSELLERRPDIAAAERQMQEENALIGVQVAAFYPDISLSALGGFIGSPLSQLFTVANRVWSLGASASETLFSGGARTAAVAAARATYDQFVAVYRQTVLTAFQQVEDALSSLRILEQQAAAQAIAVDSARQAVQATLNGYLAGTVAYTSVITEQTTLLTDQQAALAIQQSRLVASVALIEALGGGWSTTALPAPELVREANPVFP
ncbi:MAG TPA: efflux transporter outer membrane subunit [Acetobacteraceae bacterium]|jgi:NodT family efflux transporter outer membrane factor (OMF) lipoprotein|nr:efflux transporter outer membrane subunit [Acetobacteraceae bacterium]